MMTALAALVSVMVIVTALMMVTKTRSGGDGKTGAMYSMFDRQWWLLILESYNYVRHNYVGHNYVGHNYVDHNYVGSDGRRSLLHSRRSSS